MIFHRVFLLLNEPDACYAYLKQHSGEFLGNISTVYLQVIVQQFFVCSQINFEE